MADPAGVQLADEIAGDIRARQLAPGMLVASEQELRSRHDTGRSVLRQAVRILEERGVAVMRRGAGGGLVVAQPDPQAASRGLVIVMESRMQGPAAIDLLLKATDTYAFLAGAPGLDLAACDRIRRLSRRLSTLPNAEFQRLGGLQQMVTAVRGLFQDPLAGLAYQTAAEYGQDLAPYSVLMGDQVFRGPWWDALLQMVEAQIAGDIPALFDLRRRQQEMLAESQRDWSVIDREDRLVPKIEDDADPRAALSPADRLAREILRDIRLLGWTPGGRIGGAAELMDRYGVTVATLRQAVRVLEEHCAVRMERGRSGGLFIAAPDPAAAVERAAQYLAQTVLPPGGAAAFLQQLVLEALGRAAARRPDLGPLGAPVEGRPLAAVLALVGRRSGDAALELFIDLILAVSPPPARGDPAGLVEMAGALDSGDGPRARRAFLTYSAAAGHA